MSVHFLFHFRDLFMPYNGSGASSVSTRNEEICCDRTLLVTVVCPALLKGTNLRRSSLKLLSNRTVDKMVEL